MDSNGLNHSWYALHVRKRFEKLVTDQLEDKGYEGYLPLYKSSRLWSDRIKVLDIPLFSGYTFCRFNVHQRLPILLVPGVLSVVGFGRTPAAVPDDEILAIKRIIDSGLRYGSQPCASIGQSVRVERGPLSGLEGKVVRVRSDLRLIVALPLLQRFVFAEIDPDCLEALPGLTQAV